MLKKILKYIIIAALGCYLAFAFVIVPLQKDYDSCKGIVINITDNKLGTISNEDIEEMLRDEELFPEGKQMDSIRCYEIENFINAMTLIKECQVYKTNEKGLRLMSFAVNLYSRYLTGTGKHTMLTLKERRSTTSGNHCCCLWHRARLMTA
jgi:hypothetical protein